MPATGTCVRSRPSSQQLGTPTARSRAMRLSATSSVPAASSSRVARPTRLPLILLGARSRRERRRRSPRDLSARTDTDLYAHARAVSAAFIYLQLAVYLRAQRLRAYRPFQRCRRRHANVTSTSCATAYPVSYARAHLFRTRLTFSLRLPSSRRRASACSDVAERPGSKRRSHTVGITQLASQRESVCGQARRPISTSSPAMQAMLCHAMAPADPSGHAVTRHRPRPHPRGARSLHGAPPGKAEKPPNLHRRAPARCERVQLSLSFLYISWSERSSASAACSSSPRNSRPASAQGSRRKRTTAMSLRAPRRPHHGEQAASRRPRTAALAGGDPHSAAAAPRSPGAQPRPRNAPAVTQRHPAHSPPPATFARSRSSHRVRARSTSLNQHQPQQGAAAWPRSDVDELALAATPARPRSAAGDARQAKASRTGRRRGQRPSAGRRTRAPRRGSRCDQRELAGASTAAPSAATRPRTP